MPPKDVAKPAAKGVAKPAAKPVAAGKTKTFKVIPHKRTKPQKFAPTPADKMAKRLPGKTDRSFTTAFGLKYSDLVGRGKEKEVTAKNLKVKVSQGGHARHGQSGQVVYFTGKNAVYVKFGDKVERIPISIATKA
eukprot:TRINITY_DN28250_c1_g1_i1.p2 TRINITY_DN28250_c1_g1~~TRINITY_DN28250_c1_g1_i1.p2  ORF type:complete len:135 (-),score=74.33 TRINITY_DN28250_c1_g1_i1:93-497(-)